MPTLRPIRNSKRGFTLIELIVATSILSILTGMAIPLARVAVQRKREEQFRESLQELRDAIDRYKDAADRQAFLTTLDSQNYPPDLETLVKGVEIKGGKKLRFLRSIPVDPITKERIILRVESAITLQSVNVNCRVLPHPWSAVRAL